MSIGHKHRHTGRRPRRSYRSRFRAERHRRQRGARDEHGPYGPGHDGWRHDVPRDDGWLFGNEQGHPWRIAGPIGRIVKSHLQQSQVRLSGAQFSRTAKVPCLVDS